jgi:hypothetical protein
MAISKKQGDPTLTRRRWAGAATGAALCFFSTSDLFGAADFWNKKDPSAWTSDEILLLATRSPWARSARVLPRPGRDRGGLRSNPQNIGGDAGGGGGGRGNSPDLGAVPLVAISEVTVVWESAQPLLDALKSHFSSDFENHYVIGVNELPNEQKKRQPHQESAGQETLSASLQARGKEPVDAGAIQPTQNGSVMLFGFSKELLSLNASDKDIVFTLEAEQFSVKAKFDPKEMMYRGKLAL